MYIPELSFQTYQQHNERSGDGFEYRSVGWLGKRVERTGKTGLEILSRLWELKAKNQLPDTFRGLHTCEICLAAPEAETAPRAPGENVDKGEFFVEHGRTRYVLPNMVIHYITRHGYRLPEVVEEAISASS